MNIEQMAREAGYDVDESDITMPYTHDDDPADEREFLARFAALVRAHALEEAAAVCEQEPERQNGDMQWVCDASSCAKAIRALKSDSKPLGREG